MKTKDEAFEAFVSWKKTVETQSERKVKKLKIDNGLEFCNQRFDEFCRKEGMVKHITCTYTPQQNGVDERLNMTIMNKFRSMLSESGLRQKFWVEATSTAVYLINRTPSSTIEFKIPEEMWTTALSDLMGLRRFGCVAYVHSDEGKLNPRAKKGIFTGYLEGVKGFIIWLLEEKKCIISRNVVFREDQMFKEINEHQSDTSLTYSLPTNKVLNSEVAGENRQVKSNVQGGATETVQASTEDDYLEEAQVTTTPEYQLARDRPRRQINPPARFEDYVVDEEQLEEIAGYA